MELVGAVGARSAAARMFLAMVACSVVGLGCATSNAAAATATPAWTLSSVAYPSVFADGSTGDFEHTPEVQIYARNVGGAPTAGPFTITDVLPADVTASPVSGPTGKYGGAENAGIPLNCVASGHLVNCTGDQPVKPGQLVVVRIPVAVSAGSTGERNNAASISGGGASESSEEIDIEIGRSVDDFAFTPDRSGAFLTASESDATGAFQAGSHPFEVAIGMKLRTVLPPGLGETLRVPNGGPRSLEGSLPAGMIANPQSTPKCIERQLESNSCPPASQVGMVLTFLSLSQSGSAFYSPLYNMVAPPGQPAAFGAEVESGVYVHLLGRVRSDGDYGVSGAVREVPNSVGIVGAEVILWGEPSSTAHDWVRGACSAEGRYCPLEPSLRTDAAFLTLPTSCSAASNQMTLNAISWLGTLASRQVGISDLSGNPTRLSGCDALGFEPAMDIQSDTSQAEAPTGFNVHIHLPQDEGYEDEVTGEPSLATAHLKDVSVTLPSGMAINPSAANGLEACSTSQVGYVLRDGKASFTDTPAACPNASKIGSATVHTPLLEDPLPGAVYLAQPYENPFGTLLALYLTVDDPKTGIVVKIPGEVHADQQTGQLMAVFSENPQLPFEDLDVRLFGGPRASLMTPATCGSYVAQTSMLSWSGGPPIVGPTNPVDITASADGGRCVSHQSELPNVRGFEAGTQAPISGSYSPFVLNLTRPDGSQRLSAVGIRLPPGLVGRLAGIPYCPDNTIEAAPATNGRRQMTNPSCPVTSEVGQVTVGAGAGPNPYYVSGRAYLAGPYGGAPLSLVIITPAVAGPFDLGTVAVRVALWVDPFSAQVEAVSQPLPTVLQGVPLDVRSIQLRMDRPGFILNPTSCEPKRIEASVQSTTGATADLVAPFQAGRCRELGFKPKLAISLIGPTKRSGHPALKAVLTMPKKGDFANIANARVSLPHSEFLDQGNIKAVCTQPALKAGTCPAKSVYGYAKAWTPLLERPLEGPVYLGVGFGHALPDLVADLDGQIRILAHAKVDTDKQDGLRTTFLEVPDAPISRFVLKMKGGPKRGLLENSENICGKRQRAQARFVAQNGRLAGFNTMIVNSCNRKGKKRHKHRHH